jgi:hypothetical protein
MPLTSGDVAGARAYSLDGSAHVPDHGLRRFAVDGSGSLLDDPACVPIHRVPLARAGHRRRDGDAGPSTRRPGRSWVVGPDPAP